MKENNNFNLSADAQVCNNLDVRVKHKHDNKSVQYGRSMIEMLGVLAIVGVLSVGGIAGYSKAMMKFKINKTIDQISHIATNIRTLYAQQTTYAGLWIAEAIKMGVIPDSLTTTLNPYATITNTFNGAVTVEAFNNNSFVIAYNGLPKEACVALATYDWGKPESSGLLSIGVAGNSISTTWLDMVNWDEQNIFYGAYLYGSKFLPLSVVDATNGCNCSSDNCFVGWKFK